MDPSTSRQFKQMYNAANEHLMSTFGMTLTELPAREKITINQKRAAQRSAGNKANQNTNDGETQSTQPNPLASTTSSSKQYILTSTLPARYRIPEIISPSQVPTSSAEAAYIGVYTTIIAIILLSPGSTVSEGRLESLLKRMNADYFLLGEKTEKGVLARLQREGYIFKTRERTGDGEENVDFHVGPRGRAEVGELGVAGLVRKVYGKQGKESDELEKRLARSLGDVVIGENTSGSQGDGENDVDAEETQNGSPEGVNGEATNEEGHIARRQTRRVSGRRTTRRRDESDEDEAASEEVLQDGEEEDEEEEDE